MKKKTVYFKNVNIPPNTVPSVQSTAEPKRLTILRNLENMRKTGSLKIHSNPRKGSPPSTKKTTTDLLRQWKILSRN